MAETVKKATRESFGEALCELAEQFQHILLIVGCRVIIANMM